jgi:hypothetical protein
MKIDLERPKSPHLGPEIPQQPMGQGSRWPLWALVVFLVAAVVFIAWAAQGGLV